MNNLFVFTTILNGKEVIVKLGVENGAPPISLVYLSEKAIEEDRIKESLQKISDLHGILFTLKEYHLIRATNVITPKGMCN